MKLFIHTDGGARGNPGPAAVGVVIKNQQSQVLFETGKTIGEATNNISEYLAVAEAYEIILANNLLKDKLKDEVFFYLDSLLVANQLIGIYKVKNAKLKELLWNIKMLEQKAGCVVHYINIPREQNFHADSLVNKALDARLG